jgi:hypothetical protein
VAELRSFIVGVTIAGALLLAGGLAFGLFDGDSSGSPSVTHLVTPPPTRTPEPPATRNPSEFTPVPTSQLPVVASPNSGNVPNPTPTATPTLEVAPTAVPTATPPSIDPVVEYVDTANQYTRDLFAQIEYLIGNASAPNLDAEDWRSFTLESTQSVMSLAGGLAVLPAPACVSGAHETLAGAANQAVAAASQLAAAVDGDDEPGVSAAGAALSTARNLIVDAVTEVSNTIAASC